MHKLSMIFISSALVVSSSCGMEMTLSIPVEKKLNFLDNPVNQLIKAIESNAFDTCKSIIEKYPDVVNCEYAPREGDLCTPLHSAVDRDNIPAARVLLAHKALINAQTKRLQYTPLHIARSKRMAKLLVGNGASLYSKTKYGATPLCSVLFDDDYIYKQDNKFCSVQRYDIAHYLLKKGADSNALIDNKGNTLLYRAIKWQDPTTVQLLLQYNANLESKNIVGDTPIELLIYDQSHKKFLMSELQDKRIVFFSLGEHIIEFLHNGAEKFKNLMISSRPAEDKRKAENSLAQLFMMLQQGDNDSSQGEKIIEYDAFGYLFKNASFTDLEKWVGQEGIDYVKEYLSDRYQEALSLADKLNWKQLADMVQFYPFVLAYDKKIAFCMLQHVIKSLYSKSELFDFLDNKFDFDGVDEDGNTLLHRAIECKNVKAIVLLMKKNINLTHLNQSQQTVIDVLYNGGDQKCIDAFYGAFADKFFSTHSYQTYYQEIKKILKAANFDINFCDKDGKTLLHRAAESHPEKCSLLLKHGAVVTQRIIDSACSDEVRMMLQKKYDEQEQYKNKDEAL